MPINEPQPSPDEQRYARAISVSIPPGKRTEFFKALTLLQRHHKDPFIRAAP